MRPACLIDSNLWLYAHLLDQDPGKRALFRRALAAHSIRRVISTQVVAEVGCNLLKKGRMDESSIRRVLNELQAACDVVAVTVSTGLLASSLRENHQFSYWDSLIVAAALESGCTELWSEDLQAGRVVEGRLTIVNPLAEPAS